MRATRSQEARRVTLGSAEVMPYDDGDDDDQIEAQSKGSRSKRRGSGGADTLQQAGGPRSSRLRQAGGGGPRYTEVDSDDDGFYGLDEDDDRGARGSRGRNAKKDLHGAGDGGGDKRRRSGRGGGSVNDHVEAEEEEDYGHGNGAKRRRVSTAGDGGKRGGGRVDHGKDEDDEEDEGSRFAARPTRAAGRLQLQLAKKSAEDEPEEEESEDETAGGQSARKYSFRNRESTRREPLNIESTSGRQYSRSNEEVKSYFIKEERPPHVIYARMPAFNRRSSTSGGRERDYKQDRRPRHRHRGR